MAAVAVALFWGSALGLLPEINGYTREVSMEYNPGRSASGSRSVAPNVIHVRAVGPNDTLHYVWSTLGAPTVLLVRSADPRSRLRVNWTRLESPDPSGSVRVEPEDAVLYASALVLSRLFEYDDVNDTADLSQTGKVYPPYRLEEFTWDDANATINHSALTAEFTGRKASSAHFQNGSISFRIAAYDGWGRAGELPRMLHSANCSQLEVVLTGVAPRGNRSRFALELLTVEDAGAQRQLNMYKSIDDEHTPTIFKVAELVAVAPGPGAALSYVQWKPVAYSSPRRAREDSVWCRIQGLRGGRNQTLPGLSIAFAYFTPQRVANLTAFNVSFGTAQGGFYNQTRYISWSVMIGYGDSLRDGLSALVIAVLGLGLALPFALVAAGGIAVCAHRQRHGSSRYTPIN